MALLQGSVAVLRDVDPDPRFGQHLCDFNGKRSQVAGVSVSSTNRCPPVRRAAQAARRHSRARLRERGGRTGWAHVAENTRVGVAATVAGNYFALFELLGIRNEPLDRAGRRL